MTAAVEVKSITHRYGDRIALDNVSFSVTKGSLFGLVGPNGGGKSTTFKILSTLIRPTQGSASIFGYDLGVSPGLVRNRIGVVFQAPALDKKLTVFENLKYQGFLYGFSGKELESRAERLLARFGLKERKKDRVETLSGGLKRRVEIAKGVLHDPELLILDEPTTGLDPLARREVWSYLDELRTDDGMTVLLTTHLLEEADRCDWVTFLDQGQVVASDTPVHLKHRLGGDVISLSCKSPESVMKRLEQEFFLAAKFVDGKIRLEKINGHEFIPTLIASFPNEIESVTLGKPTLDDFFIEHTGRSLWQRTVEGGGA